MVRAMRSVAQMLMTPLLLKSDKRMLQICTYIDKHSPQILIFFLPYSLSLGTNLCEVVDCSLSVRILEDDASDILVELEVVEVHYVHFDAERDRSGRHTSDCLRVHLVGDDKPKI